MPAHTHVLRGQTQVMPPDTNAQNPAGRTLAGAQTLLQGGTTVGVQIYGQPASLTALNPQAVSNTGGSQPHNNMMPYLVLNFIIALQGIFPSRN
jgi:microcystin-dependent protein